MSFAHWSCSSVRQANDVAPFARILLMVRTTVRRSLCHASDVVSDNLMGVEKLLGARHAHEEGEAEHLMVRT